MKILILFAHPAYEKSRVNKTISEDLDQIKGLTFHDLYEAYPEFDINIDYEQELLTAHDCIVFQYPFFWYSTPAILKEWQDLVLLHGWAYGSKGNALKDKWFLNAVTTGGAKKAYQKGSFHNYTIQELLAPLTQTARMCKMIPLPPFVVHGTHALDNNDLQQYKTIYHKLLTYISEDKPEIEKLLKLDYLNSYKL